MKHHLIVSSLFTGGKETDHGKRIIEAVSLNLNEVTVSESNSPAEAQKQSRQALKNGAQSILVAAGDATINQVVNGFFEDNELVVDKPHLGIIPTIDGSDFEKTVGTSDHLMEAVNQIGLNEPHPIDLGRVKLADGTTRYFANAACTGVFTDVEKGKKRASWLNNIGGDDNMAFNWSLLQNAMKHRRFPLLVSIPGGPQDMRWDANCVAVCNGQSYAGGIKMADEGAALSDGRLDLVVVHDYQKAQFFRSLKKILDGRSDGFEGVSHIQASSLVLSCEDADRKIAIDLDGESSGMLPARFDVIPSAAMLF